MKREKADVLFVGAGPGDPGLLTLNGKAALEGADLVLYAGSLVNAEILSFCREGCELRDSSGLPLGEQIDIMVRAVSEGRSVVRLHTGDPSLFGAVAEQKALLEERGISVSFVPGVSSLQATAAALGIQYTVPGGSQTVICTRRGGRTPVPPAEDLRLLAAHGATVVVFLSADQAEGVARDLIAGGFPPDTPAACVYRASWEDEMVLRSSLSGLPAIMAGNGVTRQALIVVGGCLAPGDARSRLYSASFAHGYREASE
jgi:precorrin-4/cobalt-precorrin-4 C11-methyltransferase